jgi:cell division protein FtsW
MRTATTLLATAVGVLLALSLVMMSSALLLDKNADGSLLNQTVAALLGCVGLAVAAAVDYRRVGKLVWWIYGLAVVSLILVKSPLGREANGAQRWLFGTQPSEFAKLALILTLSWYCAQLGKRITSFWHGIVKSGAIVAPLFVLILLQPDRGTAALVALVALILLVLAGVRLLYVIPPAALALAALAAMIVFNPMARDRINAWLHPERHRDDAALQVLRGLFAFGEGGIEGRGLGQGTLKFKVPEVHTDFILPAVGEELGVSATLGVVALYGLILACGLAIARRAPDQHGMLLAAGVTFLIAAQACINLGVVTALIPNKGMPLPFISRGGSNIAVMLTLVGVLLGVARQAAPAGEPAAPAGRNPFSEDTDFAT